MTIETCAKVNLTLEVLGRRADGFHELATVFQAVDLCDRITLRPADELRLTADGVEVPTDARNLCWRAALLLSERFDCAPRAHIHLAKRIPSGAGLGGGSGNAAGTLAALARFWKLPASADELAELAARLGSDCAFFLDGGAAVGRGRGERLTRLPALPDRVILVLAPREPVPTGAVYGALTGFRPAAGAATEALARGLAAGVVPPTDEWLVNDLEAASARVSALVAEDRERLAAAVPGRYRLSGSGGAWFLPLASAEAEAVRARLAALWPERAMWLTRPVDWGWRPVG